VECFHSLEDLDAADDLYVLFDIVKCIGITASSLLTIVFSMSRQFINTLIAVLTGDPELYVFIAKDKQFLDVLGMLECSYLISIGYYRSHFFTG
jgi:hypothetical protein